MHAAFLGEQVGIGCALCALAHFFLLLADSQSLASFFPFSFFSITTVFFFLLPLPFAFFLLASKGSPGLG